MRGCVATLLLKLWREQHPRTMLSYPRIQAFSSSMHLFRDDLAGTDFTVENIHLVRLEVKDRHVMSIGGMERDCHLIDRNAQRIWCYSWAKK